jgi:hypothetical protein
MPMPQDELSAVDVKSYEKSHKERPRQDLKEKIRPRYRLGFDTISWLINGDGGIAAVCVYPSTDANPAKLYVSHNNDTAYTRMLRTEYHKFFNKLRLANMTSDQLLKDDDIRSEMERLMKLSREHYIADKKSIIANKPKEANDWVTWKLEEDKEYIKRTNEWINKKVEDASAKNDKDIKQKVGLYAKNDNKSKEQIAGYEKLLKTQYATKLSSFKKKLQEQAKAQLRKEVNTWCQQEQTRLELELEQKLANRDAEFVRVVKAFASDPPPSPPGDSGEYKFPGFVKDALCDDWNITNSNGRHAEMAVLDKIDDQGPGAVGGLSTNNIYIGVSKLCCLDCSETIWSLNQHFAGKISKAFIGRRGTHGNRYGNWKPPDLINKGRYRRVYRPKDLGDNGKTPNGKDGMQSESPPISPRFAAGGVREDEEKVPHIGDAAPSARHETRAEKVQVGGAQVEGMPLQQQQQQQPQRVQNSVSSAASDQNSSTSSSSSSSNSIPQPQPQSQQPPHSQHQTRTLMAGQTPSEAEIAGSGDGGDDVPAGHGGDDKDLTLRTSRQNSINPYHSSLREATATRQSMPVLQRKKVDCRATLAMTNVWISAVFAVRA